MIAHREEKRHADVAGGGKKRDAVLFLPLVIFNERGLRPGGDQLFNRCNHSIALVTNNKGCLFNSGVDQQIDRVGN